MPSAESVLRVRAADSGDDGLAYYGATGAWQGIDVRQLWSHRQVLRTLALRDLQVRYRQTLVGIGWAVLQPLVMLAIFSTLFALAAPQFTTGNVPYPLIVLCGLLPWQLFSGTLTQASHSLVANQNLIGKVYFPRLILPLAAAVPPLLDFLVALCLLGGAIAFYGVPLSWRLLFLPPLVLLTAVAGLAAGTWLAALHAMYRDVGIVVPFLVQMGFFLSPIIYQIDALVPAAWRSWMALNPMVGIIEGFRWSLLGSEPAPGWPLLISLLVVTATFSSGLMYFRRVERFVADRI